MTDPRVEALACRHDRIEVLRQLDGGPERMWDCATCFRRFYPACPSCVDVGHRGEIHVPLPPCGHEAEIERLRDGLRESAEARHAIAHATTGDLIGFDACDRAGCVSARAALAGGSE